MPLNGAPGMEDNVTRKSRVGLLLAIVIFLQSQLARQFLACRRFQSAKHSSISHVDACVKQNLSEGNLKIDRGEEVFGCEKIALGSRVEGQAVVAVAVSNLSCSVIFVPLLKEAARALSPCEIFMSSVLI